MTDGADDFLSEDLRAVPFRAEGRTDAAAIDFHHLFDRTEVLAINTALAAGRPLLVRGEPGIGKSQLARAAAVGLKRHYISHVIDARSESQELLWTFDAVRRLADAQAAGNPKAAVKELEEARYVTPGPLWWAFNWDTARRQWNVSQGREKDQDGELPARLRQRAKAESKADGSAEPIDETAEAAGMVVLIDEIDKADSSLPNGLLEAFGNLAFDGPAGSRVTCAGKAPLIVVTSNSERLLPDAFRRRCVVLNLAIPKDGRKEWFFARGRAHFEEHELGDGVLKQAAEDLVEDRGKIEEGLAKPGVAEYLDLLRALRHLKGTDGERLELMKDLRQFVLQKNGPDRDERRI